MKELDFSIFKNDQNIGEIFEGYIKFDGFGYKNRMVFREDLSKGKSRTIYISLNKNISIVENNFDNIVGMKEDANGDIYYLCRKPNIIHINRNNKYVFIRLSQKQAPLSINISKENIIVSFIPAKIEIYSKRDLKLKLEIFLSELGGIEPIHVEEFNNNFIVTDSSNHTVKIYDTKSRVIWQYGKDNSPGCDYGQLCVPVSTYILNNYIIISEQRSHRIIILNQNKQIVKQFGTTNIVGSDGNSLWAPQACIINDELYVIMCKGSRINILKYEACESKFVNFWGVCSLIKSDLNFPRSCDYSFIHKKLLVSDTYHDRIVIYNNDGKINSIIDKNIIKNIHWPRCSIWVNDDIYICDSFNKKIYILDIEYKIKKRLNFNNISKGEWLQSVDYFDNKILIAFETEIFIYDLSLEKIIWSTLHLILNMKDIHYAQYVSDEFILVSDTGNNRIIKINRNNKEIKLIKNIHKKITLNKPRMCKYILGKIYIVNSGTSQIYICNNDFQLLTTYGKNRGFDWDRLSIPRWLCSAPQNMFFISDTDNHRIMLRNIERS